MIGTRRFPVGGELERLLRDGVQASRSDARLLDRYLEDRDESAFEAIVERHGPMVLSLCRRYLYDPRDVEDAFQATFLILIRKASKLRDRASLSSWLYGVAYRVAFRARSNLLKRRSREGEGEGALEAVAPCSRPIDDSVEILDAELNRLPEKYRSPLVLCYLEGRTHDQAAAELGWPVGTVRSRMAKAREILSGRLSRRGLDASACLALPRLDPLIRCTILPSITSASTSWPATALAQGVITAMFLSQLKWIGGAAAAVGLLAGAAGVNAFAVHAPRDDAAHPAVAPADAEPPSKDSHNDSHNDEAKSGRNDDVQARILGLEAKIDRLTELLHKMEQRLSAYPATVAPRPGGFGAVPIVPAFRGGAQGAPPVFNPGVPGATPGLAPPRGENESAAGSTAGTADAVGAGSVSFPRTPGAHPASSPSNAVRDFSSMPDFGATPAVAGLRVIEAQLRNLKDDYTNLKTLRDRAVISTAEYLAPVREARILVARLEEMKDAAEFRGRNLKRLEDRAQQAAIEVAKAQQRLGNAEPGDAKMNAQADVDRAKRVQDSLGLQLDVIKVQEASKADQLSKIDELIRWARENFKELND